MRATASVRINRSIDEVFNYLTDVSRMTEWMSGVRDAKLISTQIEKGAKYILLYTGTSRRPSEVEVEVTEYERPRLFAARTTRGPVDYVGRIELSDENGATVVTNTAEAADTLAGRIASILLGWLIAKPWSGRMKAELEKLAAAIEANRG